MEGLSSAEVGAAARFDELAVGLSFTEEHQRASLPDVKSPHPL